MTRGKTYEFTIAVGNRGEQCVIESPDGYTEWVNVPGNYHRFKLPDTPGVYLATVLFTFGATRQFGVMLTASFDFPVLSYRPCRVVPDGEPVAVLHEAKAPKP